MPTAVWQSRLFLNGIFALLATTLTACGTIERLIDRSYNSLSPQEHKGSILSDPDTFFDSLFVVDLHADTLLWNRGIGGALWDGEPIGHVDHKRLIEGNIAVQVFSTVSKFTPDHRHNVDGKLVSCHAEDDFNLVGFLALLQAPTRGLNRVFSLQTRIEEQGKRFPSSGGILHIRTASDFQNAALLWRDKKTRSVGGILAEEGLHFSAETANSLKRLWNLGFRVASPTHHFDNALAGSSTGCRKYGLTDVGRKKLEEMATMGWTLDLAHSSSQTITDAAAQWGNDGTYGNPAAKPPIVSHTGFRQCAEPADCPEWDTRNISGEDAYQVARLGGVIGVIYWNRQHEGLPDNATAEKVVRGIVDTIKRLEKALAEYEPGGTYCKNERKCITPPAIRYVAFGSDWDGMVRVPFDATGLRTLIAKLRATKCDQEWCKHKGGKRYSDDDIRAIAGWNACRTLMQSLPGGSSESEAEEFCSQLSR